MSEFKHQALELDKTKKIIYTAFSKHYFYFRSFISRYVLENGGIPLNPFMIFDYFLSDTVDRDLIREGNNNLVKIADELWVFGPISDGALAEIKISKSQGKIVKYFEIIKSKEIVPLEIERVVLEDDVKEFRHIL